MKALAALYAAIAFIIPFSLNGIAINYLTAKPQLKGDVYLCGTYSTSSADEFWNSKGKRCKAYNDFKNYEFTLYAEYGLTCTDTLLLEAGWARVDESINGKTLGFDDLKVGWKHYLGSKWDHLFSAELVAIVPTKNTHIPGVRYGKYGGEINLLLTRDFCGWLDGDYDLRLGYAKFEGFPSDQILLDAVVNIFPFSRLRLSAGGFLEYGLFNGKSQDDESLFLFRSNYRLFRGELQATFWIHNDAAIFVGYQKNLWGRNVGTQGGVYCGAQIQF